MPWRYLRFWAQPPVNLSDDDKSAVMSEYLVSLSLEILAGNVAKHRTAAFGSNEM